MTTWLIIVEPPGTPPLNQHGGSMHPWNQLIGRARTVFRDGVTPEPNMPLNGLISAQ
jgi:hypothetical protein